ncbi:MAG: PIN domain nuclease [Bacteroidota bacterium]|nr:PIN domain nuclease [Bacteroidota bacterium]MDP4216797.1 PIN domain nuclease [Bacteroidota bacterium]MDP4248265.1 PIN domain nuclease [Bacteroidota bacterium]MDP4259744.1 PIN domain nuclease [Bacteroidota bacterium]
MNEPLIFDTSIWIDFLRNRRTKASDLLTSYIAGDDLVILVPTILQEVLQGIREDARNHEMKDILSYFTILQLSPIQAAIGAAELYRDLRKKGLTIRRSNDCLIAYYAIEFSIPLVHSDKDFDLISKHSKLRTWKAN